MSVHETTRAIKLTSTQVICINKYLASSALAVAEFSRARVIPQVNYMFSLGDEGNAVFALFRKIIPFDYWHMYLIAPIIAVFLFSIHFIIKAKNKFSKKTEGQK